ncbi:hypothetical protein ACTRMU_000617 [Yersinia enterocolitica]|nr:hypothetical protein [Yersinia enterocolitica]
MRDRNTMRKDGELTPVPIAAATEIFGGHIVCANAAGFAVLGAATAALTTLGVADGYADNRAGVAGDADVLVRRGKNWCFANFGGDAVTQARVGKDCYIADSQTVAATSDTNARPLAGKVMAVDTDGVWVLI